MANRMEHLPEGDLSAYLLGRLPDAAQRAVEDHLGECRECEERAAEAVPRDALVDLLQRAAAQAVPAAPYSAFGNTESSRFDSTASDLPDTVIGPEFTVSSLSSPPAALSGHSRYRVLRLLGCGGMGSVWLAEQLVMGRPVALKVIRPELLAKAGTLERFRREVQAAAKLNHPNIAQAYDAEQIGDSHFLVMEYVAGHTLSERVKAGRLPIAVACQAVRDAARGLAHAHAAGLVHRDVKPGNLIQTDEGTVKVLDFGLAISAEANSSITAENLVMGTPDYVAPEQAEDPHAADARSDIYSLGCTLYHLLSGRVPFVADSMVKKIDAHRFRDPEPIAEVPQSLWLIVAKMMAKQPAQRFQTALEVAAALEPFCEPEGHQSRSHVRQNVGDLADDPRSGERGYGLATAPLRSRETSDRTLTSSATSKIRSGRVAMLLASLALLLGVVVYRIQTDEGELVITADEDAEISVKQGGKEVTVYDTKSKQKLVLNSGTYDLELKGKPTGLKLDIEKATLTRGDKKFARIERVVARPAAPAQGAAANAPVDSDNSGRERHSLLFPSSIGDGGAHNYRVEGQFLKIDTLTHSNQLWLNYNRCQASELELHCRLRITDVTDDAYFKLVLLSDYDSELSVLIRKRGTKHKLIIESVGSNNAFKILAERPIATDFARTWIDAIVILKGTKLQFFANGELLLEAKCDRVVNRYIALAALNCLVELSDPIVLVPKK